MNAEHTSGNIFTYLKILRTPCFFGDLKILDPVSLVVEIISDTRDEWVQINLLQVLHAMELHLAFLKGSVVVIYI